MNDRVRVYVGVGSNLGNPVENVASAVTALGKLPSASSLVCSSFFTSEPIGYENQADFVNAVCMLETRMQPQQLLETLHQIEQKAGRQRDGVRWGPRTLDLDLLLYGDSVISTPTLVVPHPRMHERAFVLYPLQEISPYLEIPGAGTVAELAGRCSEQKCVRMTGQINTSR